MTDGVEAVQALRSLRRFHEECAALLKTAEELAAARGWQPFAGNLVWSQGGFSLGNPADWVPDVVFRYWHPPGRRDRILFFSVLILPRERTHLEAFREPLASVGWVQLAEPVADDQYLKRGELWLARAAFWTPEARDGRFATFDVPVSNVPQMPVRRVTSRALFSLSGPDDVSEMLDRLAADLGALGAP